MKQYLESAITLLNLIYYLGVEGSKLLYQVALANPKEAALVIGGGMMVYYVLTKLFRVILLLSVMTVAGVVVRLSV